MSNASVILRELRGDKSLAKTAKEIGITPSALANYESGIRTSKDQIKVKIAKYYSKSIESIFLKILYTKSVFLKIRE